MSRRRVFRIVSLLVVTLSAFPAGAQRPKAATPSPAPVNPPTATFDATHIVPGAVTAAQPATAAPNAAAAPDNLLNRWLKFCTHLRRAD